MVFDEESLGLKIPAVLLPKKGINMSLWAVVACDQFTSEPEYWEKAEKLVGSNPSTLRMILPEAFLGAPDEEKRIKAIQAAMKKYLKEVLEQLKPCFIFVDRKTGHAKSRKGLVVALDLEKYDYNKGSKSLIRATEGTVLERLPPRIRVREGAPLELPHIMVLIDDPGKTVIEPLASKNLEPLYDFDLMMGSGHIRGFKVEGKDAEGVGAALGRLRELCDKENTMLYAVGDGNHSLATAKAIWERLKAAGAHPDHPARHALVELVNIHDEGLLFEPIHRVLFGVKPDDVVDEMRIFYKNFSFKKVKDMRAMKAEMKKAKAGQHAIGFMTDQGCGIFMADRHGSNLEVGTLQAFIDHLLRNSSAKVDYIHGEEALRKTGRKPGNMGFYLPVMRKESLFPTVLKDGALPRKTFSMGEADEKRFYLECRKISQD